MALAYDLAFIGTSDVHQLIAWDYDRQKNQHRPVTLVLAPQRSSEAIKKALFEKQTLVWWNHTLIGRKAQLQPLLEESIVIERVAPSFEGRTRVFLRNRAGADWQVTSVGKQNVTSHATTFTLQGQSVTEIQVRNDSRPGELRLQIHNALLAPAKPAQIRLSFTSP